MRRWGPDMIVLTTQKSQLRSSSPALNRQLEHCPYCPWRRGFHLGLSALVLQNATGNTIRMLRPASSVDHLATRVYQLSLLSPSLITSSLPNICSIYLSMHMRCKIMIWIKSACLRAMIWTKLFARLRKTATLLTR